MRQNRINNIFFYFTIIISIFSFSTINIPSDFIKYFFVPIFCLFFLLFYEFDKKLILIAIIFYIYLILTGLFYFDKSDHFKGLFYFILFYSFLFLNLKKYIKKFYFIISISSIFVCIYAIFQFFNIGLFKWNMQFTTGSDKLSRVFSFFGNPNEFFIFLIVSIFSILKLLKIVKHQKFKYFLSITIFLNILCIFLLFSRSVILSLLLAFIIFIFFQSQNKKISFIIILFLAGLCFFTFKFATNTNWFSNSFLVRFHLLNSCINLIKDNAFLGYGFNNFIFYFYKIKFFSNEILENFIANDPHSSFFQFIFETGAVFSVFILYFTFYQCLKNKKNYLEKLLLLLILFIFSLFTNKIYTISAIFFIIILNSFVEKKKLVQNKININIKIISIIILIILLIKPFIGDIYYYYGFNQKKIEYLNTAGQLYKNPLINYYYAQELINHKKTDKAIKEFTKLSLFDFPSANYEKARLLFYNKHFSQANLFFIKELLKNTKDISCFIDLSKNYTEFKKYDDALNILFYIKRKYKLNNNDIFFNIGYNYYKSGKFKQAIPYFEKLIFKKNKFYKDSLYFLLLSYYKHNNLDKFIYSYKNIKFDNFYYKNLLYQIYLDNNPRKINLLINLSKKNNNNLNNDLINMLALIKEKISPIIYFQILKEISEQSKVYNNIDKIIYNLKTYPKNLIKFYMNKYFYNLTNKKNYLKQIYNLSRKSEISDFASVYLKKINLPVPHKYKNSYYIDKIVSDKYLMTYIEINPVSFKGYSLLDCQIHTILLNKLNRNTSFNIELKNNKTNFYSFNYFNLCNNFFNITELNPFDFLNFRTLMILPGFAETGEYTLKLNPLIENQNYFEISNIFIKNNFVKSNKDFFNKTKYGYFLKKQSNVLKIFLDYAIENNLDNYIKEKYFLDYIFALYLEYKKIDKNFVQSFVNKYNDNLFIKELSKFIFYSDNKNLLKINNSDIQNQINILQKKYKTENLEFENKIRQMDFTAGNLNINIDNQLLIYRIDRINNSIKIYFYFKNIKETEKNIELWFNLITNDNETKWHQINYKNLKKEGNSLYSYILDLNYYSNLKEIRFYPYQTKDDFDYMKVKVYNAENERNYGILIYSLK